MEECGVTYRISQTLVKTIQRRNFCVVVLLNLTFSVKFMLFVPFRPEKINF